MRDVIGFTTRGESASLLDCCPTFFLVLNVTHFVTWFRCTGINHYNNVFRSFSKSFKIFAAGHLAKQDPSFVNPRELPFFS